jgi:hypothetical protein
MRALGMPGDNAVVASAGDGEPLRRLELRVGYPQEVLDPDFVSLRILIDGEGHKARISARGIPLCWMQTRS